MRLYLYKTVADQGRQLLKDNGIAIQVANRLAQELSDARPELRGGAIRCWSPTLMVSASP